MKYRCVAFDKIVNCEDFQKGFHAPCSKLENNDLDINEAENDSWYCGNCITECGLCGHAVLNS